MKIFKVIRIKRQDDRGYNWEFRCISGVCLSCNLRFLCFTNKKIMTIVDTKLVDVLNEFAYNNYHGTMQSRARKVFFEYMGA